MKALVGFEPAHKGKINGISDANHFTYCAIQANIKCLYTTTMLLNRARRGNQTLYKSYGV